MADVSIQEIFDEYDAELGRLTGENIRLKKALAAYEAEEAAKNAEQPSSDT